MSILPDVVQATDRDFTLGLSLSSITWLLEKS
ncbi:hypothetical protein KT99_04299 [Shewanella benthica KT99]|uniref:Uncharacterized protein n=1 Tax=Shewanella benthica KT99 TaxID=314608 RepID=A9D2D0_9GAMM|nr:hypothetical protein KT99_04299 [Shewanella benthica KT99]